MSKSEEKEKCVACHRPLGERVELSPEVYPVIFAMQQLFSQGGYHALNWCFVCNQHKEPSPLCSKCSTPRMVVHWVADDIPWPLCPLCEEDDIVSTVTDTLERMRTGACGTKYDSSAGDMDVSGILKSLNIKLY